MKALTKKRALKIAIGLGGLGVVGALVMFSGVIPIKASAGHGPILSWILKTGMRRSTATHSSMITPPDDLDAEARVLLGAGEYEHGCRFCHGAPGAAMPAVPRAMAPHPPWLPPRIRELEAREIFYVVKHGVSFTGMPAWPTQARDDEVWSMVAFLRRMPSMDGRAYRRFVEVERPDPDAPEVVTRRCAGCHGADGAGRLEGTIPRLAGQRAAYLEAALDAYASGARPSGPMMTLAVGLSGRERREIAGYYAALPPPDPAPALDGADLAAGRRLAERGVPDALVPGCARCHGPTETERSARHPRLASQWAPYLRTQLELFARGERGGSSYAELMEEVDVHSLDETQVRDLASFYAQTPAQ